MLSPTADTIRLFLHVLSASIWVGGHVVMGFAAKPLSDLAPDARGTFTRAYSAVVWPAFVVVFATGIWNLVEVDITNTDSAYQVTVLLKITVAIASAVFAAVEQFGRTRVVIAIGGALGALSALAAVFLGVLLRTGTG